MPGSWRAVIATVFSLPRIAGLETIAFPAISCGVYGYPITEAAPVAIETARDFLRENRKPAKAIFVLFSENHREIYLQALNLLAGR